MNDEQPTQPLTDAELTAIRSTWDEYRASQSERHGVLEMVPTDIGLLDIKLTKVFAEVDRLRAANAALAERLAAGEASDGYHTHNELYDYRMLYNAHAVISWLDAGYRVVKSWRHSDGELCFGGGWFVVAAELPTGQVTNHYEADHWELFVIPEETPPAYDGHSPADAAHRLRQALGWGGDPVDS